MAIAILFNGITYSVPETGEESWGEDLTTYFVAIPQGALQKSGGTFTLTADVNFGANFGLLSKYFSTRTALPSTAGLVRLAVSDSIGWRNNAHGGNLLLAVNASDQLTFDGSAIIPGGITALTGDVTATGPGSVAATIASHAVSNAKFRQSAALSLVGNSTNATADVADITAGTDNFVLRRSGTALGFGLLVNANFDPAAAIALSKLAALTVSRAVVSDGSGLLVSATTTATEIGYVNGVTSAIQTQLNAKASATLNSAQVLVGNVSNVATAVTLSGDVTNNNTGVTAIGANKVLDTMIRQSAGLSVIGNSTNSTANVADITAGTDNFVLRRSGTALGFGLLVNANIDSAAAIAFSKLATLTSTNILVGSAGNVATSVAVTGDVTIGNTGVTAIGSAKVTNAMLATAASAATASYVALRDANANLSANNHLTGYTTTATGATTTTLVVGSTQLQYFTGSTTQIVALPVTSTLVLGQSFTIVNNSSGVVTVNSSGGNAVQVMAAGSIATVTCILTSGTSAASWNVTYSTAAAGGGSVTSVAMTVPTALFATSPVSGSPVTTTGTLAPTLATQTANTVFAGPTSGSAATPTFRALASADFGVSTLTSIALSNVALAASIGSSLLTVSLKQNDASTDATAGSPILVSFRNSTLATGSYLLRSVTAALSISTVATGCTLGLISAQNQYIYVYAIDNSGTVELALAGNRSFDEGTRYTTTAIGAGSTDGLTLYSTTARSNVAIRLLGRLLVNEATAGTYASAPTEISLMPLDINKTNRSEVWLQVTNGYGSSSTKIRRYTTTVRNVGTGITYADSATLGGSFTINEAGLYVIYQDDNFAGAADAYGFSLNTTQPTTNIDAITASCILGRAVSSATNFQMSICTVATLNVGDVVRSHGSGDATGAAVNTGNCRIIKVGS